MLCQLMPRLHGEIVTHPPSPPVRLAWLVNLFGDPPEQHAHAATALRIIAARTGATVLPVYCRTGVEGEVAALDVVDQPAYISARLTALLGDYDLPGSDALVVDGMRVKSQRDKAELIASALEDENLLLTAVHTHSYSAIDRFFLGSFSEEFFARASSPVLVLNPHLAPSTSFDRITFASDLSTASVEAFSRFLPVATALGADVTIEHQMAVRELSTFLRSDASREQYAQELEATRARVTAAAQPLLVAATAAGVNAQFSIHRESASQSPGSGFEDRAEGANTPMLALSAHGEHRRRGNLGSIAVWLMRHSARPVLVLPPIDADD